MIGFSNRFFLLKTEIHTVILNTEPFLYDNWGREIRETKWSSEIDIFDHFKLCILFSDVFKGDCTENICVKVSGRALEGKKVV